MYKEKICVYPLTRAFIPILKYLELLDESKEIVSVISPKCWGFCNKIYYDKIVVDFNIHSIPDDTDILLIPDISEFIYYEGKIVKRISEIIFKFKKIISYHKFSKNNDVILKKIIKINSINYEFCPDYTGYVPKLLNNSEDLIILRTPILAIAEMINGTDGFEVGISLRKEFEKNGYKVEQIGSLPYCNIIGAYQIPNFMIEIGLSEKDKVIQFNRYINFLIKKEEPDIIILNIPDAIQSYNEKHTLGFGILPFLIFKAVSIDFLILCTIFYSNSPELFKLLNETCKLKFDVPVELFHMSGLRLNHQKMKNSNILCKEFLDELIIDKYIETNQNKNIPILNLKNPNNIINTYNMVIKKLSR